MADIECNDPEHQVNEFVARNLWKIMASKDPPLEKLDKIISEVSEFFEIEKCSLFLKNKEGDFTIIASEGISEKVKQNTRIREGEGIAGIAIAEKTAIFMKKVSELNANHSKYKTDNFIVFPIVIEGEVKGLLNLTDKVGYRNFSQKDLELVRPVIERIKFVLEEFKKF